MFTDKSGKTFRIFGSYRPGPVGPFKFPHDPAVYAGKPSDDGHVYVGGFTVRMNPDGTNAEIIGYNYRNSYEQSVTSLGDVFQNDNDDPPACRVSWVMEYANFGFSSNDGQRTWQADRRPGQSIPVAEWRQDDPGMTPAGDVYGGGSPTGNVFYENGALGPSWEGTFFAADAGRNEVFSYQAGAPGRGLRARPEDLPDLEREAAVCRVGLRRRQRHRQGRHRDALPAVGHRGRSRRRAVCQRLDRRARRRAPGSRRHDCPARSTASRRRASCRRSRRSTPATIDGLITALRSPAVNVRAIGFEGLKARGAAAVNAVAALLNDPNPYMRGRAIYLLYQLGPEGRQRAGTPESYTDPALRIAAYRAMRRAGLDVMPVAARLARDADPGVRREVALSMRDQPAAAVAGHPGRHRARLRRAGSQLSGGAGHRRDRQGAGALRSAAARARRARTIRSRGPATFAWIAWRLHVPAAVPDLTARARSSKLSLADRRLAMDTLAFINDPAASKAMLSLAQPDEPAARAGDVVAAEPDVQRAGRTTACGRRSRRPASTIPTRSRCARWSCRSRRRICRSSRSRRSSRLTGDAARGKNVVDALPDVPRDRRHRRRARPGARWLGARQVGRGDRHGHRPARAPRSRRATRARSSRPRTG